MIQANVDHLIQLQFELQAIRVTLDSMGVCLPGVDPDEMGRVLIARHDGSCLTFLLHGLPAHVRDCLEEAVSGIASADLLTITHVVANRIPNRHVRAWRTCIFPDSLTHADYPDAVPQSTAQQAVADPSDLMEGSEVHTAFGIAVEGQLVSTCRSIRENTCAAEAWVCTLPAYRRRGYGRQVTAAWGHCLQKRGQVPFYSFTPDNRVAQLLAQSLGLIHVFDLIEWDSVEVAVSP